METTPAAAAAAAAAPAGEGEDEGEGEGAEETLDEEMEEEKVKRARKRSRYLSPPYADDAPPPPHQDKQDKEEEEASSASSLLHLQLQQANVATADLLSALLQSASASASASVSPPSPNVDASLLLRFFSLYRISKAAAAAADGSSHQDQGAIDNDAHAHIVLLSTCHAMSKKQDEQHMGYASAHHIGPSVKAGAAAAATTAAAAALQAGHKSNKDASTDCPDGVANPAPKMKMMKKKKTRKRHENYFGNPAALVLDFTKDAIDLPSKEELLSAFRRFGFVIESDTDITKDPPCRARVVFGSSAEAEAAYNCAHTLGKFGPPFTLPRLEYLPPIKMNAPSPAPKLPLSDIKKNLEKMIWSLTRSASFSNDTAHNLVLVGEMQGLMAKVDKVLSAGPSATTGHHH